MIMNLIRLMGLVAISGVILITQGCITTESFGSGRGAGAKHKGPWRHQHQNVMNIRAIQSIQPLINEQMIDNQEIYDPIIISSDISEDQAMAINETETYVVQKGDMLSQLAIDFNTTSAALIAMNNLENPDVLYVGQKLTVPAGQGEKFTSKNVVESSNPAIKKGVSYEIKSGDTLSEIAQRADVSVNDLRTLNNIQNDKIYAGQEISIPSYGKVPEEPNSNDKIPVEENISIVEPEIIPITGEGIQAIPIEVPEGAIGMVKEVQVYPGETLDDYVRVYSVTKEEILRANPQIQNEQLKEGFTIRIPISE